MAQRNQIQLDCSSILQVPLDKFPKDFTFIVNGKEYQTSRFLADIISPIIVQYHFTDEAINQFFINTSNQNNNIDFTIR